MGLFKRKVKIKDYCLKKFDYILSENGKTFMDNFLNEGGISIPEGSEANYYSNFIAAYFELANIAFSRKLNRTLHRKAIEITFEYLGDKNATDIKSLNRTYNSAFGSSFEDGIKPMAATIANNISDNNISEESMADIAKCFYGFFYGMLQAFMSDIKAVKIIA